MLEDHELQRQALLRISRLEMGRRHLEALVDGYRRGQLRSEDIRIYTNIEPELIKKMATEL